MDAGREVRAEKPMTYSFDEAVRVRAAVRKSERVARVGYQRRTLDHFHTARDIIQSGRLADITQVQLWSSRSRPTGPVRADSTFPPVKLSPSPRNQPMSVFRTCCIVVLLLGVRPALGVEIDPETAEPVNANDPAAVLDPSAAPDSAWGEALKGGDADRAVELFVKRLRKGSDRYDRSLSIPGMYERWLGRRIGHYGGHSLDADEVVRLHYEGVYGITHTFKNAIDWHHDASAKLGDRRTHEWLWQLNRHYQWLSLADAYERTGDLKYARAWERELRSWIRQCPRPEGSGNEAGSAWRTIEAGIRAGWTWPYAFQIFRRSEHVSDEALWLFVCAMREHGIHLLKHPTGRNWLTMECDGLAHAGLMFPELRGAQDFAAAASRRAAFSATSPAT